MKKSFIVIFFILILFSGIITIKQVEGNRSHDFECGVDCIRGDITGDGVYNVLDVILSVNYILNNYYYSEIDMNLDDAINVLDVIMLVDCIIYYH